LRVFELYELGLLATWETPDVVICVPRTLAAWDTTKPGEVVIHRPAWDD
jgi:hypothetical protein